MELIYAFNFHIQNQKKIYDDNAAKRHQILYDESIQCHQCSICFENSSV